MGHEEPVSSAESLKETSHGLRGTLAEQLAAGTDHFDADGVQLLKHHGSYQQDDRDKRAAARREGGAGKAYSFMVRTRIPGGKLTSGQLLAELDLCDALGNGTLRLTTRQTLQLHGVLKQDLRTTIRRINEAQLTTLATCGDVVRNVMCCPAPGRQSLDAELRQWAIRLAEHFAPRTGAYREIWLVDPESGLERRVGASSSAAEVEPIYGRRYLPRKFKIGIALPGDNCIDVLTHDLGLLAVLEGDRIEGFDVLVGGGMGTTPAKKETFPALGQRLAFVTLAEALEVAEAIVKVQRDFGNRADRKTARLKYLIHAWGLERFRAEVETYVGRPLTAARGQAITGAHDHLGWHAQGAGRWYYGLNIENGRVLDSPALQLKTALREVCTRITPGLRLTAYQNLLFTDLTDSQRPVLEALLRDHGVPLSDEVSHVRRWSMACVALPTCGLAITEAERALPTVLDTLERLLAELGLEQLDCTVRMTGCPNGCARPYNADIGLVGKSKNRYTVFLGGGRRGDQLNQCYRDQVPVDQIVPTLKPLLVYYRQASESGESFGAFCRRKGLEDLQAWAARDEAG